MAWNYARYVGRVAAAGKAEYNIPMFMNTWIKQEISGWPGAYPSGGPQPTVMDIWHAGAPAIDIFCPDCHLANFTDWCRWYTQAGNPLFIPESAGDAVGALHRMPQIRRDTGDDSHHQRIGGKLGGAHGQDTALLDSPLVHVIFHCHDLY